MSTLYMHITPALRCTYSSTRLNTNIYEVIPPLNNCQTLNIIDVYLLYCRYYLIADMHTCRHGNSFHVKFEFYTITIKASKYFE